jgi:hypothetical protein
MYPNNYLPGIGQDQPFVITVTLSAYQPSNGYSIAKIYLNGQLQSSTQHSRVSASTILTYTMDLGAAYAVWPWGGDRAAYGFQGNMYFFAAYERELNAAEVTKEYDALTSCPAGQSFSMSSFQCSSTYTPQVTMVSFTIASSDRVARSTCATVTLAFTPATPIPAGGSFTLSYPPGFFASSITPSVSLGASSVAGLTATCGMTSSTSVVITTSGATVGAAAFIVTIRGFTMGTSGSNVANGILVETSSGDVSGSGVSSGPLTCPAGSYWTGQPPTCSLCPAGLYQDAIDASVCQCCVSTITAAVTTAAAATTAQGTWSTAQLSVARMYLAATSVGNVAIFAGGSTGVSGNSSYLLFN